ncbi:MAG: 30S ribosome-binding factor RbfA [Chitinivibrionales bacterium]|nr:30S ribosome-binding factor RbfA [Chitinivibrionales bacterium]
MHEISWVIANKVNDPRIPEIATITDIKLAPDTRNATVFISLYCENKEEALQQLNKAAAYIQKLVAEKVTVKHFPKLYFKIDTSFEKRERINSLLEQVKDDLV